MNSDRSQHPVEPALPSPDGERVYRRSWRSWALYDVANSAFYLTIVTGFFPLFYQGQYARLRGGSGVAESGLKQLAGANLALAAGVAMICVAVLGPVLGAMADQWGGKKRFLAVFAGLGCLASVCMGWAGGSHPELALACYVVGTIGVAGSIVFYDALLVGLARPADLDRISSAGFAFGYAGSTLLFLLNLAWVLKPAWFGLADAVAGMRVAFVSVGVWWAAFTLPLLWWVPEPPRHAGAGTRQLSAGFRQLGRTFRDLLGRRELLLFLLGFWLYSDGIGTIIKLASAFGDQLAIQPQNILAALLVCQVVAVPCALAFGRLAGRFGAKTMILAGLVVYLGICLFGYFLSADWHFYLLALLVGAVQGGTQALSRSLFASMIPASRSGEYFGFFSTMEKFAGILGPFLLAFFWRDGGDPRPGILAIGVFFIVGGALLCRVDVEAGRRQALAEGPAAGPGETGTPG